MRTRRHQEEGRDREARGAVATSRLGSLYTEVREATSQGRRCHGQSKKSFPIFMTAACWQWSLSSR